MNFFSKCIVKLQFDLIFIYALRHDNVKFHWNIELETLLQQIKTSTTNDVTATLPNTNHSFFITIVYSLNGVGFLLCQMKDKGKLDIKSFNSRNFNFNEQKLRNTNLELIGIEFSLTKHEQFSNGSDHFLNVLNDHKPMFISFTKKSNFSSKLYTAQMQLNNFKKSFYLYGRKRIFL